MYSGEKGEAGVNLHSPWNEEIFKKKKLMQNRNQEEYDRQCGDYSLFALFYQHEYFYT